EKRGTRGTLWRSRSRSWAAPHAHRRSRRCPCSPLARAPRALPPSTRAQLAASLLLLLRAPARIAEKRRRAANGVGRPRLRTDGTLSPHVLLRRRREGQARGG